MTVSELIKVLKEFESDTKVVVWTDRDEIEDWYMMTADDPDRVIISLLDIFKEE